MKRDLDYVQATQKIIERTVSNNISELQDITASICVRVDVSSSQSCPHQWKFHGKNCYYFSTEKKNWTNALWYCIQNKSFLVSIWSDTEQGFLKDSINNTEAYWLGLTDVEKSGHWKWKEGDLFASTAFWNPWSLMKESNQHCGIMHPNGTWGPAMCSHPYQWICKKKVICWETAPGTGLYTNYYCNNNCSVPNLGISCSFLAAILMMILFIFE